MDEKKAVSILSKKRFQQIEDLLRQQLQNDDKLFVTMEKFKEIMNFDPTRSRYNEHVKDQIQEYRRRKAQAKKEVPV